MASSRSKNRTTGKIVRNKSEKNAVLKDGWKPMPLSIKVLFILYLLGIIFMLFGIGSVEKMGTSFFGANIAGIAGMLIYVIVLLLNVLLLYAIWRRYYWGWIYGMVLFAFGLIDTIFSLIFINNAVASSIQGSPAPRMLVTIILVTSLVIGIVLELVLMWLFYRNKDYFKN